MQEPEELEIHRAMKAQQEPAPARHFGSLIWPLIWLLAAVAAPAILVFSARPGSREAWFSPPRQEPPAATHSSNIESVSAYRERMHRLLESYGWIDREKGIVHVPIEQGMQAVLDAGLPARSGQERK